MRRTILEPKACFSGFFPEALQRVLLLHAAASFTCQLLMPTCRGVISPANFSWQLFESYFTCQLLMPTLRELLHLPTSHANFLRVISPANFSCQLHLPTSPANFSRVMTPANFSCQLVHSYFTSQLVASTFRVLSHYSKSTS